MKIAKQKGVAAVEFTILLPILLLLVIATAEFGRAIYQYSNLTRIVRDAGRYLSATAIQGTSGLDSSFSGGCSGTDCDDNCNDCVTQTKDLVIYGLIGGSIPLLNGLNAGDITVSGDPDTQIVTISVVYDWQPLFGEQINGFGFGDGIRLGFDFNVSYSLRAI
ncbi:pilus assembly protein [Shewanella canadensis]|uniref:Pilus assembly protein n=1 Tax=Shewanella canadensis TaxID=271096 RepID=A0A3S0KW22_9GAMM|nr:TadE/TadG family type IV pilus assembly protein [Shewanella canadensis]RTR38963.1 pilus assembly protein [Shewanella canadensis]